MFDKKSSISNCLTFLGNMVVVLTLRKVFSVDFQVNHFQHLVLSCEPADLIRYCEQNQTGGFFAKMKVNRVVCRVRENGYLRSDRRRSDNASTTGDNLYA